MVCGNNTFWTPENVNCKPTALMVNKRRTVFIIYMSSFGVLLSISTAWLEIDALSTIVFRI